MIKREPADEFCRTQPKAFTLDTEDALKSAASLARENLEALDADLFGMDNYQDPHFSLLSSVIIQSIGCVKQKLAPAELDPKTNGYLIFKDSPNSPSAGGVTCYSQNGDDIIQNNDYFVDSYHPLHSNQNLQDLMIHETKHACGQDHDPKFHGYSTDKTQTSFDEKFNSMLTEETILLLKII